MSAPPDSTRPLPAPPSDIEIIYRQPFIRWFGLGAVRLAYRQWTRVAAHLFPEGSRREDLMERIGIPLPDRLDYSWITPQLAVGGRVRPGDIPRLARENIGRVVDVRAEHCDDEAALRRHAIELLYLPTPDTYPLSLADMERGAQWINAQIAAGQKVLVHCEHGVGRSVLLAAAVLVGAGYSAHAALELVAAKRWQAAPNRRQVLRLNEYARQRGVPEE